MAAEPARALERILATALLLVVATAALGAASLLFLHSFRPFAWLTPPLALAILLWRHRDLLRPLPRKRPAIPLPTALALVAALVLLAQATLLHHASVHIGRDEGVYAMQAWTFALEEQPGFDEPHRRTWIGVDDAEGFAGGAPIFPPAYAVLLGVGFVWGGDAGSHAVDGVLVALSALLLYALARRLMPAPWALGALAFFSLFHGALWFSRTFGSENLVLPLFLGAALLLVSGRPWWGLVPVAGLLLARVDTVLFPLSYLLAALLLGRGVETPRARWAALAGTAGVLLVAGLWSARVNPEYVVSHLAIIPRLLFDFILPQAAPAAAAADPGGVPGVNTAGYNLRRMIQWGLGPLLLLAAARFALARPSRAAAALLAFGAPGLAYLLHAAISPDLPFYFRRFYSGLAPLAILLGFLALADAPPRGPLRAGAAVAGVALVASAAILSFPIWGFSEWEEIPPQLDALARDVEPGRSLLLPPGQPGGFAAYLEMRAGLPSVYMRSVPYGLPPGSPMTLENWRSFTPPGTTPLLASEVSPQVALREPVSPYVENDDLRHVDAHALQGERVRRLCDFLGAFYGKRLASEGEGCGRGPPTDVETWSIALHLYDVLPDARPLT